MKFIVITQETQKYDYALGCIIGVLTAVCVFYIMYTEK